MRRYSSIFENLDLFWIGQDDNLSDLKSEFKII